MAHRPPKEGEITKTVYQYIHDNQIDDAIKILQQELGTFPNSRAALSLLGYLYYQQQEFNLASQMYGQLSQMYTNDTTVSSDTTSDTAVSSDQYKMEEYKLYYIQSLIKAALYEEASTQILHIGQLQNPELHERLLLLQASIHYESDELALAKSSLDAISQNNGLANTSNILGDNFKQQFEGALLWKEKRYSDALKIFQDISSAIGTRTSGGNDSSLLRVGGGNNSNLLLTGGNNSNNNFITYNIGLCYYSLKNYGPALKACSEIIERGIREHPELSSSDPSSNNRSVGNSNTLKSSCLIEAFNLKVAIEYTINNNNGNYTTSSSGGGNSISMNVNRDNAKEIFADMPYREESELDQVTLHNSALLTDKPSEGIRKLNFLLQQRPSPPETFVNLLLLYCKYNYFDLAADILAENHDLTLKYLSQQEYEFLDALILAQNSPEDAFRRFEELGGKYIEALRRGTKAIQDARRSRDQTAVKKHLLEFDEVLGRYVPVLMGSAKIYWEIGGFSQVEKIFRSSAEWCSDDESWKLNVAHVFFMQEKFKDCIRYYEPFVRKHQDNLLGVTAIILANLCVAYVMTSANEEAEELMRLVEKEEERVLQEKKQVYHLCIINLVIGTLYCSKGNFEFGISRIIKSLEPYERKLGSDTWWYAKKGILALAETLSKNMLVIKDDSFDDLIAFFDSVAQVGKHISVNPLEDKPTIAKEARLLKKFFLKIRD